MSINASVMTPGRHIVADAIWGFRARKYSIHSKINPSEVDKFFLVTVPLWFPFLLLLIAPLRWLIAGRGNAAAFQVIAKQP